MVDVVVVGLVCRDLVVAVDELPGSGSIPVTTRTETLGGAANQAVAARQLGLSAALVGVVGDDAAADLVLDQAGRDGIDVSAVVRRGTTPLVVGVVAADGTRRLLEHLPAESVLAPADVRHAAPLIAAARVVVGDLQQPDDAVVEAARLAAAAGALTARRDAGSARRWQSRNAREQPGSPPPKEYTTVNTVVSSVPATRPQSPELPFAARGELSAALLEVLVGGADVGTLAGRGEAAVARTADAVRDDDLQLSLFLLYAQHYGTLDQLDPTLEWSPDLIGVRQELEVAFEAALREQVEQPSVPAARAGDVADALFALTSQPSGPSLAKYVAKRATLDQVHEMLIQRSIYTLREADPHTWAIPRLTGRAKAALVEIQSDEYGGGRTERVHQHIYAATLRGTGLSDRYGTYVDHAPAITLASFNMMSMFGLNRRLLGAIVGHLAAYEMTASIPCRLYADGMRRLGISAEVTYYFDEHVEADAVHEQIAARDLAGSLAEDRPELLADIMFGAAACLTVDGAMGDHILQAWKAGTSSLVRPLVTTAA